MLTSTDEQSMVEIDCLYRLRKIRKIIDDADNKREWTESSSGYKQSVPILSVMTNEDIVNIYKLAKV